MKVICLLAISLDGQIGKSSDHFPDWTGAADKKRFVQITKKAGNLIMGANTFRTIGRALPGRRNIILTREPEKWRQKFDDSELEFSDDSPEKVLEKLEKDGFEMAVVAGGQKINSIFAQKNLIDELWVSICPKILGPGISIFDDEMEMNLELISVEKVEDLIFAKFKIQKKK